jgi:hypothetical protein
MKMSLQGGKFRGKNLRVFLIPGFIFGHIPVKGLC